MEIELRMRTKTGIYKKKRCEAWKAESKEEHNVVMARVRVYTYCVHTWVDFQCNNACGHHLDDKVHILLEELHNSHSLFAKVTLRDRQLHMSNAYAWLPVVNELCCYMSPDC